MKIVHLNVCISLLASLIMFSDTSASAMMLAPESNKGQWESLTTAIIGRYSRSAHDVFIRCQLSSWCVSSDLLKNISIPVQLTVNANTPLTGRSIVVLVPQTQSYVASAFKSAINNTIIKFVVLTSPERSASDLTMEWILSVCWQNGLLNVVVIPTRDNNSFPLYTYHPFRKKKPCFDTTPVLADVWNDGLGQFTFNRNLFPERKVWNLQGCSLKISSFNLPPAISLDRTQPSGDVKGTFADVFRAMVAALNFNVVFIDTNEAEWFGSVSGPNKTGVRGAVLTGKADIGFSYFQPIGSEVLDYDSLAQTSCVTWCLGLSYKKKSIWWPIITEFTITVWLLLFVAAVGILVTFFLQYCTSHVAYRRSAWYQGGDFIHLWAGLTQTAIKTPRFVVSLPLRVLWALWLIVSLVLSTAYLGAYKSLRTVPLLDVAVKSLEDLTKAHLQAWYLEGVASVIDDESVFNPALSKLRDNSVVYDSRMTRVMIEHLRAKNVTVLLMKETCQLYSDMLRKEQAWVSLYAVQDSCMEVTPWHFFVMSKESVYTQPVAVFLSRLNQAGIVQRCFQGFHGLRRDSSGRGHKPLDIEAVLPAFLLLSCGLVTSLSVFFLENLWAFLSRCSLTARVCFVPALCSERVSQLPEYGVRRRRAELGTTPLIGYGGSNPEEVVMRDPKWLAAEFGDVQLRHPQILANQAKPREWARVDPMPPIETTTFMHF